MVILIVSPLLLLYHFKLDDTFQAESESLTTHRLTTHKLPNLLNLTILIPCHLKHLHHLYRFLDSMRRTCADCPLYPIHIVVTTNQMAEFLTLKESFNETLPLLKVKPFYDTLPLSLTTNQSREWNEDQFFMEKGYSFQSIKKLYGCLDTGTKWCWMMDSECFFIRNTTVQEVAGEWIKAPFIIHDSGMKTFFDRTQTAKDLLGYHGHYGWLLEYYMWVMDTDALSALESHIRQRAPTLWSLPANVFIELTYWMFIIHESPRYGAYRVLETRDMFSEHYITMEKQSQAAGSGVCDGYGFLEYATHYVTVYGPDTAEGIYYRKVFRTYNLTLHRPPMVMSANEFEFIRQTPSIKVLMSNQPQLLLDNVQRLLDGT